MNQREVQSLLFALVLILGFAGGIMFVASLGASAQHEAKTGTTASPASLPPVTTQGKELLGQFSAAFEAAAAKVNPSVVPIFSEAVQTVQNPFAGGQLPDLFGDNFFGRFFNFPKDQKQTVRSLGSGVIVSSDGYILTNNHVVKDAQKVTVVLNDKKKYPAKVVGTDPLTDIAVIKIDANNLPAATLGDSDTLHVGEWVIAVGNPFQLMHTVTAGIVSAVGRSSVNLADYEDFIQTDASINPGNSGGALSDLEGNVVGINTAILSSGGSEGNIGIGFAIPINMAKNVMHQLITKGKVVRGYVGLYLQDIDDPLAKALGLSSTSGALVSEVTPGGPADKAGVQQGDVILAYNGKAVDNTAHLRNMVAGTEPGTSAKFEVLRKSKKLYLTVVLGDRPEKLASAGSEGTSPEETVSKKLGLTVQTLTPDIAKQLGYKKERGVVVTSVEPGSPGDDAGIQKGDLIVQVNQKDVRNVGHFERDLSGLRSGDNVALLLKRGEQSFYVALQLS